MKKLYIRIAFQSDCDPKRSGAYRFSESSAFRLLMIAWAYDTEAPQALFLDENRRIPYNLAQALTDPDVTKITYDAAFTRVCLSRALGAPIGSYLPPDQWLCLKSAALYLGWPEEEKRLGAALGMKSDYGSETLRALLKGYAKNTKLSKSIPSPRQQRIWQELMCAGIDWLREVEQKLEISKKMPASELEVYYVSQLINDDGVQIDTDFVGKAIGYMDRWKKECVEQFRHLTGIREENYALAFRQWLTKRGYKTDSVSIESMNRLRSHADKQTRQAIDLWTQLRKNSIGKYKAIAGSISKEGRLRGLYQYCAARVGRFGNGPVQVDNLPASSTGRLNALRETALTGSYEQFRELSRRVPSALSELLPSAFIADRMSRLCVAEYDALEKSVTDWLCEDIGMEQYIRKLSKAIDTCASTGEAYVGSIRLDLTGRCFSVRLPSRRLLYYNNAEYLCNGALSYSGYDGHHRYSEMMLNGYWLATDIVQAIMRDILVSAVTSLYLSCHDVVMFYPNGIVIEDKRNSLILKSVECLVSTPYWAEGLNLNVRAYWCKDYFMRANELSKHKP